MTKRRSIGCGAVESASFSSTSRRILVDYGGNFSVAKFDKDIQVIGNLCANLQNADKGDNQWLREYRL